MAETLQYSPSTHVFRIPTASPRNNRLDRSGLHCLEVPARSAFHREQHDAYIRDGCAIGVSSNGPNVKDTLSLVERIEIAPGKIMLNLDLKTVSVSLDTDADALDANVLQIEAPFQVRKRGVETKIILAETPRDRDEALIRKIALSHYWLERIKAGETFGEIAEASNISNRRVQHMIDLAFLAPDLVRDILEGKQPISFTSDWCKSRTLPSNWQDQRALLATL